MPRIRRGGNRGNENQAGQQAFQIEEANATIHQLYADTDPVAKANAYLVSETRLSDGTSSAQYYVRKAFSVLQPTTDAPLGFAYLSRALTAFTTALDTIDPARQNTNEERRIIERYNAVITDFQQRASRGEAFNPGEIGTLCTSIQSNGFPLSQLIDATVAIVSGAVDAGAGGGDENEFNESSQANLRRDCKNATEQYLTQAEAAIQARTEAQQQAQAQQQALTKAQNAFKAALQEKFGNGAISEVTKKVKIDGRKVEQFVGYRIGKEKITFSHEEYNRLMLKAATDEHSRDLNLEDLTARFKTNVLDKIGQENSGISETRHKRPRHIRKHKEHKLQIDNLEAIGFGQALAAPVQQQQVPLPPAAQQYFAIPAQPAPAHDVQAVLDGLYFMRPGQPQPQPLNEQEKTVIKNRLIEEVRKPGGERSNFFDSIPRQAAANWVAEGVVAEGQRAVRTLRVVGTGSTQNLADGSAVRTDQLSFVISEALAIDFGIVSGLVNRLYTGERQGFRTPIPGQAEPAQPVPAGFHPAPAPATTPVFTPQQRQQREQEEATRRAEAEQQRQQQAAQREQGIAALTAQQRPTLNNVLQALGYANVNVMAPVIQQINSQNGTPLPGNSPLRVTLQTNIGENLTAGRIAAATRQSVDAVNTAIRQEQRRLAELAYDRGTRPVAPQQPVAPPAAPAAQPGQPVGLGVPPQQPVAQPIAQPAPAVIPPVQQPVAGAAAQRQPSLNRILFELVGDVAAQQRALTYIRDIFGLENTNLATIWGKNPNLDNAVITMAVVDELQKQPNNLPARTKVAALLEIPLPNRAFTAQEVQRAVNAAIIKCGGQAVNRPNQPVTAPQPAAQVNPPQAAPAAQPKTNVPPAQPQKVAPKLPPRGAAPNVPGQPTLGRVVRILLDLPKDVRQAQANSQQINAFINNLNRLPIRQGNQAVIGSIVGEEQGNNVTPEQLAFVLGGGDDNAARVNAAIAQAKREIATTPNRQASVAVRAPSTTQLAPMPTLGAVLDLVCNTLNNKREYATEVFTTDDFIPYINQSRQNAGKTLLDLNTVIDGNDLKTVDVAKAVTAKQMQIRGWTLQNNRAEVQNLLLESQILVDESIATARKQAAPKQQQPQRSQEDQELLARAAAAKAQLDAAHRAASTQPKQATNPPQPGVPKRAVNASQVQPKQPASPPPKAGAGLYRPASMDLSQVERLQAQTAANTPSVLEVINRSGVTNISRNPTILQHLSHILGCPENVDYTTHLNAVRVGNLPGQQVNVATLVDASVRAVEAVRNQPIPQGQRNALTASLNGKYNQALQTLKQQERSGPN